MNIFEWWKVLKKNEFLSKKKRKNTFYQKQIKIFQKFQFFIFRSKKSFLEIFFLPLLTVAMEILWLFFWKLV